VSDLVRRMRDRNRIGFGRTRQLLDEAADEIDRLQPVLVAAQEYFAAYNAADEMAMKESQYPIIFAAHKDTNLAWLRLREAVKAAGGGEQLTPSQVDDLVCLRLSQIKKYSMHKFHDKP